jgi:hypothetical protein
MILNQSAPPLKAEKVSDSSHWYGWTQNAGWHALYTPTKNYTLREARIAVAGGGVAVPSTTTYLGVLEKAPVIDYKLKAVANACWDLKNGSLTRDEWVDAAVNRGKTASHPARDLGSNIHGAIETSVAGRDYDATYDQYVTPVMEQRSKWGLVSIAQEECVGSLEYGYGGKADDLCEGCIVVDYKSRKNAVSYKTDWAQIASYGYAKWGNDFFTKGAGIVFPISTGQPGLVSPEMKPGKDLVRYFDGFLGLTAWWRTDNKFDPRSQMKAAA